MNRTDRLTRKASGALTKGLLNAPGENNCFLNSAVQVLLHLDVFRRSFREISGHYCVGESCIFCALKVIFTQIQYSDEAALPPDALRQALAVTFKDEQRFQLQDMDDAAECLENILNRLHFHFAMNEREEICSAPHCISHRKFAMEIMEQSCCPSCKATSEPLPFSQLVHYVSVSALCHQANISSTKHQDFGTLLQHAVNKGDLRKCPGIKCNKKIGVQQSLLNCPDVVCIGLIWDSENPDLEQITQLLDCIDPVLRLSNVFPLVVDANAKEVELMLVGVVTYYGKHYSTYFKISDLMTWIYFDDAVVKKYGSEWETIRKKCFQNHYQPLLLLYVNEHAKPVNTKTAPAEVIMVNSETLLAIQNANRSNEKTQPNNGKTFSVLNETKSDDGAGARLSSSSSHSTISEQDMETEVSSRKWKKDRRPIKLIREFGADIKKAFSRNRNSSPTREHNSVDIKSEVSRDDGENSILPEDNTDSTRDLPRSASNSPTPDGRLTTRSFTGDSRFNAYPESKIKDSSDLMHFTTEDKASTRQSSSSLSIHGRDVEDLDSGLGSSQSSSPATSSVSSVDTNGDDLIDFSTRTQNYSKAKTLNLKINVMIQEGESYLKKSFQEEKNDLPSALSMVTHATRCFRLAKETNPSSKEISPYLRDKYMFCLERSRDLLHRIEEHKNASTRPPFSTQEKQTLVYNQRLRDEQFLNDLKHGGNYFPKAGEEDTLKSSRSPNGLYSNMSTHTSKPPSTTRRSNSRVSYSGNGYYTRDDVNCSQRMKPDSLCYSPVHYGRSNGLNHEVERLNLVPNRKPTVAHVSTSFVPIRDIQAEKMLTTSTVLPNSRNQRNNDSRRYSVYDNMPLEDGMDSLIELNVTPRTTLSPVFHPETREIGFREPRRRYDKPEPPPYNIAAKSLQNASRVQSRAQSANLLQRFNAPLPSDELQRINGDYRMPRCHRCNQAIAESNSSLCRSCLSLDRAHLKNTTMQY